MICFLFSEVPCLSVLYQSTVPSLKKDCQYPVLKKKDVLQQLHSDVYLYQCHSIPIILFLLIKSILFDTAGARHFLVFVLFYEAIQLLFSTVRRCISTRYKTHTHTRTHTHTKPKCPLKKPISINMFRLKCQSLGGRGGGGGGGGGDKKPTNCHRHHHQK